MSYNIEIESGKTATLHTSGKYCDRDVVITATGSGGGSTPVAMALIRRGVGFIDTGINGANSNLTIKIRYEFLSLPSGYWTLIRAYSNESTDSTRIIFNKETITYCCLNSVPTSSLYSSQKRYKGIVYTDVLDPASGTNFTYTTNGVSVTKARTSGNPLVGKNLTLFLDSATTDSVTAKVYYLKIYDGDTLVRDYVPHIDSSGECGMYDKVTQQFYGNDGEGTFEVETVLSNGGGGVPYEGDYEIIPKVEPQTMPTKNKVMTDDVTIKAIPFAEVANETGGKTATIG